VPSITTTSGGADDRPDRFEIRNYSKNVAALIRALGIQAQVADIERIRKGLSVERLVLVGHSFGGFLAALYAAEFPGRVEKLVLVAPADLLRFPPPGGGLHERVKRLLPEGLRRMARPLLRFRLDLRQERV